MLIVTNRRIVDSEFVDGIGTDQCFGEKLNRKGASEIRLAHAEKADGTWQVRLVPEPGDLQPDDPNPPSRREFQRCRKRAAKAGRDILFFVHGFNQNFRDTLERGHHLGEKYGVEVIVFSWPSNPGGQVFKEYKRAKRAAFASAPALDAVLEKLASYLQGPFDRQALADCDTRLSMLVYSLGNHLFKSYVEHAGYGDETNVFDNVVLCQADVDNEGHELWVDSVAVGKRVYITINERDQVLKWSDANFQGNRLGRTATRTLAEDAAYFDFTGAPGVGRTHNLYLERTNKTVKRFFKAVLRGRRGEDVAGIAYDPARNTWGCVD